MKKIFAICAYPVEHSLSPPMQQVALDFYGIEAEFLRFKIAPANLAQFIQKVRSEKISGLAISLPHKETIIPLLDDITEQAKKIGAVNTLFWRSDKLCGDNTDADGFWQAVENSVQKDDRVAIIGAGGAARAMVYILRSKGIKVTIFNRTEAKAEQLAKEFGANFDLLDNFRAKDFTLVANASSVGLRENKSPVPKNAWGDFLATAFDAIFDPLMTSFLQDASEAGAQIITGEKMLLYQGMRQFSIWTGKQAPESAMQKALIKALS